MNTILEQLKEVINQVEEERKQKPQSGGIQTALEFLYNALEYLEEDLQQSQ